MDTGCVTHLEKLVGVSVVDAGFFFFFLFPTCCPPSHLFFFFFGCHSCKMEAGLEQ